MNFKKSLTSIIFSNVIVGASLIAGCANQQSLPLFRTQTKTTGYSSQQPSKTDYNNWSELRKAYDKTNKVRYEFEDPRQQVWNSPKKTIELGYADCEDKASLGAFYAEPLGYPPEVLILFDEETHKVHVVTLLEDKNNEKTKYGAFDSKFPIYPSHNSIDSLVKEINKYHIGAENFTHCHTLDLNSISNWRTTDENLISKIGVIELKPVKSFLENTQRMWLERKGNLLYLYKDKN